MNGLRNSGGARFIADTGVELGAVPGLALRHPSKVGAGYVKARRNVSRHMYGKHARQFVEHYPPTGDSGGGRTRVLYFIHGGAWGSGKSWYYALMAPYFTDLGWHVFILSYRTYPTGVMGDQVEDVGRGAVVVGNVMRELKGGFETVIMGHSSGGHISLRWVIEDLLKEAPGGGGVRGIHLTHYVGLAGVYDVAEHHLYEKRRGLEEFSPMGGAAGGTFCGCVRESVNSVLRKEVGGGVRFLLIAGVEDEVVPFTNTAMMGRLLRGMCGGAGGGRVVERYFGRGFKHESPVIDVMVGGGFGVGKCVRTFVEGAERSEGGESRSKL